MAKKIDPHVVEVEAKNLSSLLAASDFKGPTELGRAMIPPRERGDVHQHLSGNRPIPLEAAMAYSKVFNCPLAEISQRWADLIELLSDASERSGHSRTLVRRICAIAETISDLGLKHLLVDAEHYAEKYPLARKHKGGKAA